jgi:hypothetical protein
MLTAWGVWKHRNTAVFDNARLSVASLLDDIRAEAWQWVDAGAKVFASYSFRLVFLG